MKKISIALLSVGLLMVTHVYADSHESRRDVMKADTNGDGKVSFEEFKAPRDARIRERFKRLDANGDGYIDLEEKKVAKEKRKAEKKAKRVKEKQEVRDKYSEERKRRKKHFHKYQ